MSHAAPSNLCHNVRLPHPCPIRHAGCAFLAHERNPRRCCHRGVRKRVALRGDKGASLWSISYVVKHEAVGGGAQRPRVRIGPSSRTERRANVRRAELTSPNSRERARHQAHHFVPEQGTSPPEWLLPAPQSTHRKRSPTYTIRASPDAGASIWTSRSVHVVGMLTLPRAEPRGGRAASCPAT